MKKFLYFIIFTFGLLIAQNAFAGIILRPVFHTGLVGYWDFQEGAGDNVYDKSGQDNDGTWNGTGSHWADGKIGKGGSFNGSNDYVDCANNNGLNITATTTVVAWIKKNGTQENGYGTIWHDRAIDHRNRFFVLTDGSLLAQYIIGGNDSQPTAPANSVLDNVWTHVILTYDGSEIVFWVNGIKQTPVAATGAMSSSTANKWIGLGQSSGVYNFNGIIDEVRLYNRALSASEVERIYKLSKPKMLAPTKTGLVGYWSFEENTGTKVGDMSGNGNHGTWTGTGSHWTTGKFGKGGSFNGSSDYVDVADNDSLDIPTDGAITIGAWINAPTARASKMIIFSAIDSSWTPYGFLKIDTNGKAEWHLVGDGGNEETDFPFGVWDDELTSTTTVADGD